MWSIFTPTVLVLMAGGFYTLGFLIINQVILRAFTLAGSVAYIAYYATAADVPLWDAIYTTMIIGVANVIGFCSLFARNAKWSVPSAHQDIYPMFNPILPGDFRALMRLADRKVIETNTQVTVQGQAVSHLYYVICGNPTAIKDGGSFLLPDRVFVGEVAYLLGKGSAATTVLPVGAEVLVWEITKLRRAIARKPRLKLALDAVISQDLARKVTLAIAPPEALAKAAQAFSSAR